MMIMRSKCDKRRLNLGGGRADHRESHAAEVGSPTAGGAWSVVSTPSARGRLRTGRQSADLSSTGAPVDVSGRSDGSEEDSDGNLDLV